METKKQKLIVIVVVVGMFFLGAWLSAGQLTPDQERLQVEMTALKAGYDEQIRHAYNEAIDTFVVKGRQQAMGNFSRHLNSIRTVYKDCREFIKK